MIKKVWRPLLYVPYSSVHRHPKMKEIKHTMSINLSPLRKTKNSKRHSGYLRQCWIYQVRLEEPTGKP
jgi:hypothetical protein